MSRQHLASILKPVNIGSLILRIHFGGSGASRENKVSAQNGLARESSNLRSMDYGGYVDMSVYRRVGLSICRYVGILAYLYRCIGMSICRYIGWSMCRCIDMSVCLYRFIGRSISIYRFIDMSISRYIGFKPICRYVDMPLVYIDFSICRYVDIGLSICQDVDVRWYKDLQHVRRWKGRRILYIIYDI